MATFTTHPDALRGALQDDYDVVRDTYRAVMKMAVFSLERLDARDVDAAASWSDVLRACVSRGYAERWSATLCAAPNRAVATNAARARAVRAPSSIAAAREVEI